MKRLIDFIANLFYRIKGFKKIRNSAQFMFLLCLKCNTKLRIHKNYGKLHVFCRCGNQINIFTGKSNSSKIKKATNIYDELKLHNYAFIEKEGNVIFCGKLKNISNAYLVNMVGAFTLKNCVQEILFFPEVHLLRGKNIDCIDPNQEIEFSHFLTEIEAKEAKKSNFEGFKLTFLQYDKGVSKNLIKT